MIYVSSSCIKGNKIDDVIKAMATQGITNIELSGGTKYYSNYLQDLIRLKNEYNLKYVFHAYFPPPPEDFVVNLASCNDKIYKKSLNYYLENIQMMKHIGCNTLSIHAGFLVEITVEEIGKNISNIILYDANKSIERFCDAYNIIQKECKKNKISLYLENNVLSEENYKKFDYYNPFLLTDYNSYIELRKILKFDLLLDLAHLYVSCNSLKLDYEKECKLFQPYVSWLHLSHNDGIVDSHKPLCLDSPIVLMYKKIFSDKIDLTLETKGDIADIKKSISLL